MGISMRKNATVMLVLVFLVASCLAIAKPAFSSAGVAEDSWALKAPMQVARSSLRVAVVNGKIYAIGGGAENGVVGTNEEYDPATDTWTLKTPMPTPREYFATAVYQNKIYCIGGSTSSGVTGINEVYDPTTDTWENKTSMPTARILGPANVAGGKIYLIGGLPNGTLNEVYDPATDTWTTKAPIPIAAGAASGVFNNKIYFVGGFFDVDYNAASMTQIYNPNTDTWSLGTPPPTFFLIGSAGVTTGAMAPKRIYVFDSPYGDTAAMPNDPLYTNQVYNPEIDSWTFGANIPTYREHFAVAVVNDLLYVIGGFTQTYSDFPDDWMYGPKITLYATNEQYTPVGYGTPDPSYDGAAPEIAVLSPENKTYYTANVTLDFTVNEPVFSVHYKLDGETAVEISGNTTIAGLAIGVHNVTVSAFDAAGNMGASGTVFFAIAEPEPFPTVLVATASGASVAIIGVGLLVYFKKRKH
jgi:N-acetylneuraminic acid mutarotase